MNIKLIYKVTFLTVLWMTSFASSQDTKSNTNDIDPFGDSSKDPFGHKSNPTSSKQEGPFGPSSPNETKDQKQTRIIGSQNAIIKSQKQQIGRLENDIRNARSGEQFAMDMSLKTIQTLLNHHDVSNQTLGLRLLETVFERAEREGLAYHYETKLFHFCRSNLKSLLGSDSPEIRSATIRLFETFPGAAGAHFGFQPLNGYWHPINDSIGKMGKVRREMFIEDLVFGGQNGSLMDFLQEVELATELEFDHDHDVDLDETKIEFDLHDVNTFELLDAALLDLKLGYAIDENQIRVRRQGSDDLIIKQLFNVRGLLTQETDMARIISVVKAGIRNENLLNIVEVDRYRIMVSGTEQQLRAVAKLLGLLAAPAKASTLDLQPKDEAQKKSDRRESPNSTPPKKMDASSNSTELHSATTACNQILTAIQNLDGSTLVKWCRPEDAPSTDEERREFVMAVSEMKETLRTKRTSVLELREGRISGEFIGLIEVIQGEAFVIVVSSNPNNDASTSYFFRGLKSPDEQEYRNLKMIPLKTLQQ